MALIPLPKNITPFQGVAPAGSFFNQQKTTPQASPQPTPPMGVRAKSVADNTKPVTTTIPQNQVKTTAPPIPMTTQDGKTASIDTNYYMRPGESVDAYNKRVADYNASKAPVQAPVTASKAPATGQNAQPAQTGFTPNAGLYGQLITRAANTAAQPSLQYTEAYQKAQDIAQQIEQSKAEQAKQLAGIASQAIPLEFQQGRGQIVNQQALAQQGALSGQLQAQSNLLGAATAQQQAQQAGLTNAAGLAAPVQVPYSAQFVTPFSGQQVGGGQMTGSLQDAVNNVVQKLQAGQMTYNDATQALAGYGQGGINALQQALPAGFNIAQSNTLAGQQGSITPALNYATLALNHAKDTLSALEVPGQTSNIPVISDISNWFSNISGIGKEATRTKAGALAEARSAIQSVLASVRGGNPTEYTSQSYSMLPDNATPSDIDAAISNLSTLGSAKQQIYATPGTSTGGQFQEGQIGAGGGLIFKNGKWVVAK